MNRKVVSSKVDFFLIFYFLVFSISVYTTEPVDISQLTLEEIESLVMRDNRELISMNARVQNIQEGKSIALSDWFPQLVSEAAATRRQITNPADAVQTYFRSSLQIQQILFDNSAFFSVKDSSLKIRAIKVARLALINDLLFSARTLYYKILLDRGIIENILVHIKYLGTAVEDERERLQYGQSTLYEVNQYRASMARLLPGLENAKRQAYDNKVSLLILMGIEPTLEPSLGFSLPNLPTPDWKTFMSSLGIPNDPALSSLLEQQVEAIKNMIDKGVFNNSLMSTPLINQDTLGEWVSIAEKHNPTIKLQEIIRDRASLAIRKSHGDWLPSVGFQLTYASPDSVDSPSTPVSGKAFGQDYYWNGRIAMTWPLFEGGRRIHATRASRWEFKAADTDLLQKRELLIGALHDQSYFLQQAYYSYLSAQEGRKVSEEGLYQAKEQLKVGSITDLDYRNAIAIYIDSKTEEDVSVYAMFLAYFKLQQSLSADLSSALNNL